MFFKLEADGTNVKPISGIQVSSYNCYGVTYVSIYWIVNKAVHKHVMWYSDVMVGAVSLAAIHIEGIMHPVRGRFMKPILLIFSMSVEKYEVRRARVIVHSREANVKRKR